MDLPTSERLNVARELHDGIAQDLVGIGYSLDLLLAEPSLSNAARRQMRQTRLEVDSLITKVRRQMLSLRSHAKTSLSERIHQLAHSILTEISYTITLEEVAISTDQIEELLIITTEILRNAAQHSRATHVAINLYPVNNRTCLEISDDGIGGARVKDEHFGLTGVMERVQNLQGSITIDSNEGTRIALLL
jgi:hypothetical protein